jgi:hypothetical protein
MSALACRRFRAKYVLPGRGHGTRERLDRVLEDALGPPLERALARRGLRSDEEICLRDVQSRVHLRLAATDGALAERWSAAVADAVADAVEAGGPGVVRYGSRRQALLDLVTGAAGGELTRVWAWRQLGLWHPAAPHGPTGGEVAPSREEASRSVAEALLAEPSAAVAVLAAAAARGSLPGLLQLLPPESWLALADAADACHASGSRAASGGTQQARARAAALRIVQSSALARAATAARPLPGGAAVGHALARLASLEAEPALAAAPELGDATAAAVAELLATGAIEGSSAPVERIEDRGETDGARAAAGRVQPARPQPDAASKAGESGRGGADRSQGIEDWAAPAPPNETEAAIVPPSRVRDVTHWGALLFLLHVLDELGLAEELGRAADLQRRSLRWSLHRIALLLAPIDAEDPAALAFAGLIPDTACPSEGRPAPDPAELHVLDQARARIVALLRTRLEAAVEEPDDVLVERVCRRAAEVVADPGWIELRFSVDDADAELRRALLDLDPGWVPWLGCIVRFRYV